LEFKIVDQILATLHGTQKLERVPCSRADVFSSSFIPMLEKRLLMKVLTMAANYEEHADKYEDYKDKPYREFLQSQRLNSKLQDFIIYSIAMVTDDTDTVEGLKWTKNFLRSLGRYGNSAFLWPTYGVGEIPQAFSRLSAVFGGLFCLRRSAKSLVIDKDDDGRCTAIIDSTGQKILASHVIVNERLIPVGAICGDVPKRKFYRAVFVTNASIYPSDNEHISVGILNPTATHPLVRLIEVGSCAGVCPHGSFVVHALIDGAKVADSDPDLKELFARTEQILFASEDPAKPKKLWASYFSVSSSFLMDSSTLPRNVHVALGPDCDLGFDSSVNEAREIFDKIYPGEEFLPRAPDPEEIIYDDGDEGYNSELTSAALSSTHSIALSREEQQSSDEVQSTEPSAESGSTGTENEAPTS